MKKNRILFSLVTLLLIVIVFGVSFALYLKAPADKEITIGVNTNNDVQLELATPETQYVKHGLSEAAASGKKLSVDTDKIITVDFGATKGVNSVYTQDIVLGMLKVEIVTSNTDLQDFLQMDTSIDYTDNTWAKNNYTLGALTEWADDKASRSAVVATKISSDFTLTITLSINDDTTLTNSQILAIAEANYSVNITFLDGIDYDYAYIVGSMTNWQETEAYQMVPSLETLGFQWEYRFASALSGVEFKAKKGDVWSDGSNWTVSSSDQLVRWTGANTDSLYNVV